MSRRSNVANETRPLSDTDLLQRFDEGLETLSHLASIYDAGHTPVAFSMATEISKLFNENRAGHKTRGDRTFPSPVQDERPGNLMSFHRLYSLQIKLETFEASCVSEFFRNDQTQRLPFNIWWDREVIYRGEAFPVGQASEAIAGKVEFVPDGERRAVTRRDLIKLVRDKLGSHTEANFPMLLDELDVALGGRVNVTLQFLDSAISTVDGSLPIRVGAVPAMVRQIAHEVLAAYDRT